MKAFRVVVAVCAIFMAAACYPVTTSIPVGASSGLSADPALAGLWRAEMAHSEGETVYFHFLPMEDGSFNVVIISSGEKPGGEWNVARATAAKIGDRRFLNAELVFSDGKPESSSRHGTVPLLYRTEKDGRVSLFLMSEDETKKAIQKGEIAGTIEPGEMGDAFITATGHDLDSFLASHEGSSLFNEKFATLTKVHQ